MTSSVRGSGAIPAVIGSKGATSLAVSCDQVTPFYAQVSARLLAFPVNTATTRRSAGSDTTTGVDPSTGSAVTEWSRRHDDAAQVHVSSAVAASLVGAVTSTSSPRAGSAAIPTRLCAAIGKSSRFVQVVPSHVQVSIGRLFG